MRYGGRIDRWGAKGWRRGVKASLFDTKRAIKSLKTVKMRAKK